MMIAPRTALLCACLMLLPALPHPHLEGQGPPPPPPPYSPPVAPASGVAEGLTHRMGLPEGFAASVFAAEPMVANPVAFWMTPAGVCYVAETFRQDPRGIPDNRTRPGWIPDDLASRTLDDRSAMYRRHHPAAAWEWTRDHERIRRLVDLDADGRVDRATVFADGFNALLDGTGAGVLARGPDVFYACIPHLWRLRDRDGDGYADERTALHRGFGVRVAFRGHDLHGLVLGPDGRLYFSIGDRGYDLTTPEGRTLSDSNSGAVFRCELDGSALEVFATGLRNPQDLAFDDLGNLFTGDNNADAGDAARIVWVIRDGDSGWRGSFQYLEECGPWRRERWCEPAHAGQAAFLVPPVATLGNGLAGLASYPGTGLPDRYRASFLLCDFVGTRRKSGLRAFRLEPAGSSFKMVDDHWIAQGCLPTDVHFGADGSVYFSDFGHGWAGNGTGRIFRLRHLDAAGRPEVGAVATLLRAGFDARTAEDLATLLGHADRRVRQEARLALVARGLEGLPHLETAALRAPELAARLQGLWGLWHLARRGDASPGQVVAGLLADPTPEMRAQAVQVLGDLGWAKASGAVATLLEDASPRVRFFAAQALGRMSHDALPAVIKLARKSAEEDPFLRHATISALARVASREDLKRLAGDPSPALRRASLLVSRRRADPAIARFLDDPDPAIVLEAARAIYDVPIAEALSLLANLIAREDIQDEALLRRILAANDLLSGSEHAHALARYATRAEAPTAMRALALQLLVDWHPAPSTDSFLHAHRPRPERGAEQARAALEAEIAALLRSGTGPLPRLAAEAAGRYRIAAAVPPLLAAIEEPRGAAEFRVAALRALRDLQAPELARAATRALADARPAVRGAAVGILVTLDAERALPILESALRDGTTPEKQAALTALGRLAHPRVDQLLAAAMNRLLENRLEGELLLELLAAVEQRSAEVPDLKEKRARYEERAAARDPLHPHRPSLLGGDPERGRGIFENNRATCVRCHSRDASRPGLVGAELEGVGSRRDRAHLLRALLDPSGHMPADFQVVLIETIDEELFDGLIVSETPERIVLEIDEGEGPEEIVIPKREIAARRESRSAMPGDLARRLSAAELRDLVAFLASLQ